MNMFYPLVDLCTGLSVLYLYHRLGTGKLLLLKKERQTTFDTFEELQKDQDSFAVKDRLYDIKMTENRMANMHATENLVNSTVSIQEAQYFGHLNQDDS